MTPRALITVVLVASLLGADSARAFETARDEGAQVALAQVAALASSTVAEPGVKGSLDVQRPAPALPAPAWVELAVHRPHPATVAPTAFAAHPDVVTCPAQGPPASR